MTDNIPPVPTSEPAKPSRARTISLGAAIIAVPIAASWMYNALQNAADRQNRAIEESSTYDITALKKVDPALIRYREVGRIHSGLLSPRVVGVDAQGRVLVGGDKVARIFTIAGDRVRDIQLNQTPTCIAATKEGNVLVGMADHVEVFRPDGADTASWPAFGAGSVPTAIAVHGDDIYVADSGRRVVVRCTIEGRVEAELGRADPSRQIPGLVVPSPHLDVAVATDGMVWISNPGRHRMEAYNRDGEPQRFFGSAGTGIEQFFGCCNPSNFSLLSDGQIVTAEKGIPRIKTFLPDGRFDSVVASPDNFGDNNMGLDIAVDLSGRVLVLEPGTQNIRIFARS